MMFRLERDARVPNYDPTWGWDLYIEERRIRTPWATAEATWRRLTALVLTREIPNEV